MMPRSTAFAILLGLLGSALFLSACSGAGETTTPPAAAPPDTQATPAGPAFAVLYVDADGLKQTDLRAGATTTLALGRMTVHTHAASPDGRWVAAAVATGDSVRLVLVDTRSATLQTVHAAAENTVYSLAWAPDGPGLAFGFYAGPPPTGDDRTGPGGLRIADARDGSVRDVGCSTATIAYHWLPEGRLAAGDGRNLYVVDQTDCATRSTVDARRMHELAITPGGRRMAYLYRELQYDPDQHAYVPDSTLFIADLDGGSATDVAGDAYRAHRPAWSPDGTVLAFDVASPDHDGLRLISLYDRDTEQATYLIPPDPEDSFSDTAPVWSPSGDRLAFQRWPDGTGTPQPMVYTFTEMLLRALPTGPLDGAALIGWAGDDAVLLRGADGAAALAPVGGEAIPLPEVQAPLHAWPLPPMTSP